MHIPKEVRPRYPYKVEKWNEKEGTVDTVAECSTKYEAEQAAKREQAKLTPDEYLTIDVYRKVSPDAPADDVEMFDRTALIEY